MPGDAYGCHARRWVVMSEWGVLRGMHRGVIAREDVF